MKINEFIEKVNEVAYAECNHGTIFIYSRKVPVTQMRDWFLCLDPQEQNFHYGYDWESIDLTPGNLFKQMFHKLVQLFCNHSYVYYGTTWVNGNRVVQYKCSKCNKTKNYY